MESVPEDVSAHAGLEVPVYDNDNIDKDMAIGRFKKEVHIMPRVWYAFHKSPINKRS